MTRRGAIGLYTMNVSHSRWLFVRRRAIRYLRNPDYVSNAWRKEYKQLVCMMSIAASCSSSCLSLTLTSSRPFRLLRSSLIKSQTSVMNPPPRKQFEVMRLAYCMPVCLSVCLSIRCTLGGLGTEPQKINLRNLRIGL